MKKKDIFLLIFLLGAAFILILFSDNARIGAYQGLILAQNTIVPSLLPLLIIFLLIIKTPAKDVLARAFGFISKYTFNLPEITFPAIFLGLIGGYPTGALLCAELYNNEEIDKSQAHDILCFNFCGGCGFIITAVGSGILKSQKAGIIIFASNIISNIIIAIALSFKRKRKKEDFYSFSANEGTAGALQDATDSAVKSVLSITAFVILFSAVNNIFKLDNSILPLIEITNGICTGNNFSLPKLSFYLAFGGICIHMQVLPVILKCKMKYSHFLLSRIISALLSYQITRLLLLIFPITASVFSNTSNGTPVFSSVNLALSFIMILSCFVFILDLKSKKRAID